MTKIDRYIPEKFLHEVFDFGLWLKGLDGILETIGGLLLLAVKPQQLMAVIKWLVLHELAEDPKDFFVNYLLNLSRHLSLGAEFFGALYLLAHGLIKIAIVWGLLKNKLWAYPVGIIVFSAFGVYQIYRYSYSHAFSLIVLTILDVIVILLTWHEYLYVKEWGRQGSAR